MPELQLSLSFRFVFLLLVILCSIAGAIIYYRVTVPPVPSSKRFTLIFLRSFGLFLLFLLIGEPLLSLITRSVDQPIVTVLVDNSKSMTIKDRTERRDKVLRSVLQSDVWQQISGKGKLTYALFDGKVRNLINAVTDSLTFGGESTDIAEALKSIKHTSVEANLQAVVIITDGNSTVGINPVYEAEELGVPVFTVGIGDTSEQKDLLVRKVLTNDITYVGTKVPVHTTVHSAGFGGERVQVSLHDDSIMLDEKMLMLESGTRDYNIPLSLVPNKEGMQKFTVEISSLPGELTTQNNRTSFFTKVLKSKLRVALIAGAPSQDVAFVYQAFKNDKNIEVKSFIERNEGQFYENILTEQSLREVDCLALVDFPTTRSNPRTLRMLLDAANAEKPLLIVLSRTVDFNKLHTLDQLLPFDVENITSDELQVFAAIPESQRNNPILKIGSGINTIELWAKLPPIFQLRGTFLPKIESQILVGTRFQSMMLDNPLIVTRHVNRKKTLSVLGYGLWRWKMLSDAGSETERVLESFINNSIRWLTTQEDEKRIRVQPTKHIYTTQDAVDFNAQVYDDNYQPIEDAQIEVQVKRGNEMNPLILDPIGGGQYQSAYDRLAEGEYLFTATVTLNGTTIGSDQGTFSVGGLNAEYLETRMNKLVLKQIAAQTGGQYYDSDEFESLPNDINKLPNFKPRDMSKSSEIEIWNSRWMLALVIFIFAMEWFVRKQNGML